MQFDVIKMKHANDVPNNNVNVDLIISRITVVRILVNDCLRMKKVIQYCAMDYDISESCYPSVNCWQEAREVEGILDLTLYLAKVV